MRRSCASRPPGRPISYSSSPNCLSPPISPMFAKPRAEPPPVDLGSPASCPPCPGHTVVRRADRPGRSVMRSSLPRSRFVYELRGIDDQAWRQSDRTLRVLRD
ncbi:uncharacterized protein LOC100383771 [Zea mays]|uniref:Uncharacterized protein n=1 Tax=Zea mays TaxID=4577 RepID=C0PIY1_MAIZE|nr:uncharacterized protein LOC100383771 [Zea mays]ACN35147.1 unknown [Zea mays]|eukprot:NP_001169877.1 uncharacterized protein LOC100383771 [Zea mays]